MFEGRICGPSRLLFTATDGRRDCCRCQWYVNADRTPLPISRSSSRPPVYYGYASQRYSGSLFTPADCVVGLNLDRTQFVQGSAQRNITPSQSAAQTNIWFITHAPSTVCPVGLFQNPWCTQHYYITSHKLHICTACPLHFRHVEPLFCLSLSHI